MDRRARYEMVSVFGHVMLLCANPISNRKRYSPSVLLSTIFLLIATRISRRWNQTGQKFAGAPDIGHTFLFEHTYTLWALVGLTYLWNLQSLTEHGFSQFSSTVSGLISTCLATVALTFKLAFANEDTPELMVDVTKSLAENVKIVPLLIWARSALSGIGVASIAIVLLSLNSNGKKSGESAANPESDTTPNNKKSCYVFPARPPYFILDDSVKSNKHPFALTFRNSGLPAP